MKEKKEGTRVEFFNFDIDTVINKKYLEDLAFTFYDALTNCLHLKFGCLSIQSLRQTVSCVFTTVTVSISKLRNPKHREVTKTRRKRRIQKKVSMLKVSILALMIIMIISLRRKKEKKTKR